MARFVDKKRLASKRSIHSTRARSWQRSRTEIKAVLEQAFRKEFPRDTIDISDGYADNIHVMVVSRRFDELNERQKQDMMWNIIDQTDLSNKEKQLISLLYPVSPAAI